VEKNSFARYLELSLETGKGVFVMTWCKGYATLNPDLALMARQNLAMHATSVTCEQLFKRARRILDAFKKTN
jgi:hypothetical protein